MTAAQSVEIYEILSKHFSNKEDARKVVESIEKVVDEKVENRATQTDAIVTKDIEVVRQEMRVNTANLESKIAESKADLLKWMVGMWVAQMAAILFILIKK